MTEYKKHIEGSHQKKESDQKIRIDDEDGFWLNMTKSGKGVIIVLEDKAYISSLSNVKDFVKGDRRGVKFNHLRPEED